MVDGFMSHKETLQQHFTDCPTIREVMHGHLGPLHKGTLLEPSVGHGALIADLGNKNIDILAIDIDPGCVAYVARNLSVRAKCCDFLLEIFSDKFDYIIANPPYGGKQSLEKRKKLKSLFPGSYVKETYSLFLEKSLSLLKDNGKLCFIIPTTFLYLNRHKRLYQKIINEFEIAAIDTFPAKLFPNISFGYADMCIISIIKSCAKRSTRIRHIEKGEDFALCGYKNIPVEMIVAEYSKLKAKSHNACIKTSLTIGDIAKTATGFYSGDDHRWYRVSADNSKYRGRFDLVDDRKIYHGELNHAILNGIETERHFIPVLKGGGYRYTKPRLWFVDWSKPAVAYYKTNKKARFQNSGLYFTRGIGVPMVKTKILCSSIIDGCLFDQSIVGVFPHDESLLYYLLAFFNSDTCVRLISLINPSANNSAKYIQRIPFVAPRHDDIRRISGLVTNILESKQADHAQALIDDHFKMTYFGEHLETTIGRPIETPPVTDLSSCTTTGLGPLPSSNPAPTETILAYLRERGSISSSEAQAATSLDPATLRSLFKTLIDQGLVRTEGQRRGTRYLLGSSQPS